jgi:acyl carrier protein
MGKKEEIKEWLAQKVKIKAKLLSVTFDDEISDELSLTGSGLFDSMDFMNLIVEVEEKFLVEADFSDFEPEVFTTFGGFVDCIKL